MSKRGNIKTSRKQIIEYWETCQDECELSVDWAEAEERCWRCGCETNRKLDRCHIIPHALGGKDEPANFVLLCKRCHAEGPNVSDPEIMWDWIKSYGVAFYDTFWIHMGLKEHYFIYRRTVREEIEEIVKKSNRSYSEEEQDRFLKNIPEELNKRVSIHFGQHYLNVATVAGALRMIIKDLANELGVNLDELEQKEKLPISWWLKY